MNIDENSRLIRRDDGSIIYMTPVIWNMFKYLYDRRDTLVSGREIYNHVSTSNRKGHLRNHIMQLRKGLAGTGFYLHTIRPHGYILCRNETIEVISSGDRN